MTKPNCQPEFVRARQLWRGIFEVTFRFKRNGRHYRNLFRKVNGVWSSGTEFPVGTHGDLLRAAPPQFKAGLDLALNSINP